MPIFQAKTFGFPTILFFSKKRWEHLAKNSYGKYEIKYSVGASSQNPCTIFQLSRFSYEKDKSSFLPSFNICQLHGSRLLVTSHEISYELVFIGSDSFSLPTKLITQLLSVGTAEKPPPGATHETNLIKHFRRCRREKRRLITLSPHKQKPPLLSQRGLISFKGFGYQQTP